MKTQCKQRRNQQLCYNDNKFLNNLRKNFLNPIYQAKRLETDEYMIINKGEKNGQWKGDMASKKAIHAWVRSRKPQPENCEKCNKKNKRLDLANISKEYKRDINDYEYLCRKCHMKKDGRLATLKKTLKSIFKDWVDRNG